MSEANGNSLDSLVRQAVRWLPISTCYQCPHRDAHECRCWLTNRKRNRHPPPEGGIPKWCPLPNVGALRRRGSDLRSRALFGLWFHVQFAVSKMITISGLVLSKQQ
jgi:hypothetical protein